MWQKWYTRTATRDAAVGQLLCALIRRDPALHTTGYLGLLHHLCGLWLYSKNIHWHPDPQKAGLCFTVCLKPNKQEFKLTWVWTSSLFHRCHFILKQKQKSESLTIHKTSRVSTILSHRQTQVLMNNTLLCLFLVFALWPSDKLTTGLLALSSWLLQRSARLNQHDY